MASLPTLTECDFIHGDYADGGKACLIGHLDRHITNPIEKMFAERALARRCGCAELSRRSIILFNDSHSYYELALVWNKFIHIWSVKEEGGDG